MKPALVDASALIALFDPADAAHPRYTRLLQEQGAHLRLHSVWPCIVEASHLLRGAAKYGMLRWIGHGAVQVFPIDSTDLLEFVPVMQQYSEPPRSSMDLADAALYWLAAETGIQTVMTRDVRDFSRYRLPDGGVFEIL